MIDFLASDHYAILYIPEEIDLNDPKGLVLYSKKRTSPDLRFYLEKNLNQSISLEKIKRAGLDEKVLKSLNTNVSINTKSIFENWKDEGEETASAIIALFAAILIMFFIVLYGGQVMRGVIEEKTNRIIEVMISSVKPFELMMGKIIGIALMSLTQFLIWVILTGGVTLYINNKYEKVFDMYSDRNIETTLKKNPGLDVKKATEINQLTSALRSVDFVKILLVFAFYFLGGYLLFASLFAAIGSAVDVETDTQQFVFPLIAPLMFCIVMATTIINNPDGSLAFWLSIIPFTSPVAMMLRLPFGVPIEELFSSMAILIISFVSFTWVAGRIYRTGILMYGKKIALSELMKWLFYKS
jgi:ABC-2 type transport system permease protein